MDDDALTFGPWLQRRRQALHLTQQQLGQLAGCATETIRKVESDQRRPSEDVARLLAAALQIPPADHDAFVRFARGTRAHGPAVPDVAEPNGPRPFLPPSNVPVAPTPLIGREEQVVAVGALLLREDVRLVTLTGPGGVGKTRLAQAVATAVRIAFLDGVYFVNLAPISQPELVLPTIAQLLDVQEPPGQPLLSSVQKHLSDRQMLLVLDNYEQVLAAGLVVSDLLSAAPHLRVLVTSRIPLHLRGEHEIAVTPLALPGADVRDLERLTQYDAVRLFITRAQAIKADFQVTNANAPAVADICVRLDGLPLAIELAAPRVKLLSPEALLPRLSHRLGVLIGGQRDLPARQQTLRATIDWSYALLDPAEQTLFARLAVFVSGCTLEAAEAICAAESDHPNSVLDRLQSLLDKSLLQHVNQAEGTPRVIMLETIHEYALERLAASAEAALLRQRHAAYYLALVEPPERAAEGFDTPAWLARLDADQDNLRAVLRWATVHDAHTAVSMAASLKDFWYIRGSWSEGQRWIAALLPLSSQSMRSCAHVSGTVPGRWLSC